MSIWTYNERDFVNPRHRITLDGLKLTYSVVNVNHTDQTLYTNISDMKSTLNYVSNYRLIQIYKYMCLWIINAGYVATEMKPSIM